MLWLEQGTILRFFISKVANKKVISKFRLFQHNELGNYIYKKSKHYDVKL